MTDAYEALVLDLDGTVVDLDVDWDVVHREAAAVLRARGIDTEDLDLWHVLERAVETGYREAVEDVIAEHERSGARSATRLDLAAEFPEDRPIGVCSLNCESACRIALELHGLDGHVDAIVGRDSVSTYKPDPEPLLETIRLLDADPDRTLFVGDGERDEEAARRAGVDFQYVSDWLGE